GCTVHLATRHRLVTVTRDWRSESLIMSSDVLTLARQSNFNC
ncbi:transposase, partial [Enterococcus faecium]